MLEFILVPVPPRRVGAIKIFLVDPIKGGPDGLDDLGGFIAEKLDERRVGDLRGGPQGGQGKRGIGPHGGIRIPESLDAHRFQRLGPFQRTQKNQGFVANIHDRVVELLEDFG